MAELEDALDLGSSGEIHAGSTPAPRTSAALEDGPFQGFDAISFTTARAAAYGSAAGAPGWTFSAGAAGSLTRHAMNSETTHNATPESVNVGR